MPPTVLFCSDPLNPRRVDDHFADQAEAVRALGGTVALLDHDALSAGDVGEAVRRVPEGSGPLWYRGWMVTTARYSELADGLRRRGADLAVAPVSYATAHELPGWYDVFAELTPTSVWMPSAPRIVPSESELAELVASLRGGPGIVKDFVKSRKHEWDTACFVHEIRDTAGLRRIVERFVELQEGDLAGGIVVRVFEDFAKGDAGRPAEARVWWSDGEPVLVSPHPDSPGECPDPDLSRIRPAVAELGCRFVTTDVARRTDGVWRVVEVGDGQVSDLASSVNPAELMRRLPEET